MGHLCCVNQNDQSQGHKYETKSSRKSLNECFHVVKSEKEYRDEFIGSKRDK